MSKWECTECGHVAEGHKPPVRCPDCDAPASAFEPYEEEVEVEDWDDDDWDDDDDWEDDDGDDDDDWDDDDGDDDWDLEGAIRHTYGYSSTQPALSLS